MKSAALFVCLSVGAVAFAAAPQTSKKAPAKSSKKSTKKSAPARQQQPTADRYREIQQALIDKGFLEGPATGQWDEKSIAAFKKFERSQNLADDGQLDSLALIALGLGPKRAESLPRTEIP